MKDQKTYLSEIFKILSRIDDTWILKTICGFIRGMVKGTQYE